MGLTNSYWEASAGLPHPPPFPNGIRIKVDPADFPLSWEDYKSTSGVEESMARGLEKAGELMGASPSEWFASVLPIPQEKWLGIEVWTGTKWLACQAIPLDGNKFAIGPTADIENQSEWREICQMKADKPQS